MVTASRVGDLAFGPVHGRFELLGEPPHDLVSNVRVIPFVRDHCVVVRTRKWGWTAPGGTLEPGETLLEAARRELREEAGAELLLLRVFGAWRCRTSAPTPYRPHLPHPEFLHVTAWGDVRLVGNPTSPPGGERISAVACVTLHEAVHLLEGDGEDAQAELYRLGARLRETGDHPGPEVDRGGRVLKAY